MMSSSKQISVTVSKEDAERLALLRKCKHRLPNINEELSNAILEVVEASEKRLKLKRDTWKTARACPSCVSGTLYEKTSKGNTPRSFIGCSRYPDCKYTESIKK